MPRRSQAKPQATAAREKIRKWLPEPTFIQGELDRHAKLLLAALLNPSTLMSGLHAVSAFRKAAEEGLRRGPRDPRVLASVKEAERAFLFALQEATNSMLLELGEVQRKAGTSQAPVPAPEEPSELTEVAVEREDAAALPRPEGPRRARRARRSRGA
ncbi:MAG: hypothetical protein KGJ23_09190 [Euryarchaeota archaeon]|nr:hypothetical protein [Euryarchaeota archaeon]MDE1836779.1 hypothetical protein [Euryarchaeota archaeon]MDE1879797.1 hypothetical protein [Euryarchaeota archaeon]MDE2044763.1 hypothetical protein [Thermoplasmata archaeon]